MAAKKETPDTWPLGDFLKKYRREGRTKELSARKAAALAGISDGRWRQIEQGFARVNATTTVPVMPKASTLAAMLRAIDAPLDEGFKLVGYRLEDYPELMNAPAPAKADATDYDWFTRLPREDREKALADLQRLHMDLELEAARRAG